MRGRQQNRARTTAKAASIDLLSITVAIVLGLAASLAGIALSAAN